MNVTSHVVGAVAAILLVTVTVVASAGPSIVENMPGEAHPSASPTATAPPTAAPTATASPGVILGYRRIDLGTLGGTRSAALSVNDLGQVVGSSETTDGHTHPFLWQHSRMTDLGTLRFGPDEFGVARDINNRGEVVGASMVDGRNHATLWRAGTVTDLGNLGGGYSFANAINDRGQIVGNSEVASGEMHGFLWQDGRMTDLGLAGPTDVADINDSGQVVGSSGVPAEAFLWRDGVVTWLDATRSGSMALAINDRGEIVGPVNTRQSPARATLWWRGTVTDIGVIAQGNASTALAINDRGQVLGAGNVQQHSPAQHAYVWQWGTARDLSGFGVPESVTAINNDGQIAGTIPATAGGEHAALFVATLA